MDRLADHFRAYLADRAVDQQDQEVQGNNSQQHRCQGAEDRIEVRTDGGQNPHGVQGQADEEPEKDLIQLPLQELVENLERQ